MLTNNLEMQILKRDVIFHLTMSKIVKALNPAAILGTNPDVGLVT